MTVHHDLQQDSSSISLTNPFLLDEWIDKRSSDCKVAGSEFIGLDQIYEVGLRNSLL